MLKTVELQQVNLCCMCKGICNGLISNLLLAFMDSERAEIRLLCHHIHVLVHLTDTNSFSW